MENGQGARMNAGGDLLEIGEWRRKGRRRRSEEEKGGGGGDEMR
jgi:hypothetical protein